jgi:hypothetical protein
LIWAGSNVSSHANHGLKFKSNTIKSQISFDRWAKFLLSDTHRLCAKQVCYKSVD